MTATTKPLYALFYTKDTPYEREAIECEKTLRAFNLNYRIWPVDSRGSWELNTQIKASVVKDALDSTTGPVVYVDADSRVESYPILLDQIECDIAFHYFRGVELLSGTLYLGNTKRCKQLVDEWIERNNRFPGEWDQRVLQAIISKNKDIDWLVLPETYVYIDGLATTRSLPIIRHTQASRRLKNSIK